MNAQTLPPDVVAEDHRLDDAASRAAEQLARLRWHWTLDVSNAHRAVDRAFSTVHQYAHGFVRWSASDRTCPISESIHRAGMAASRETAVEAVAEAFDVSFRVAAATMRREIRSVREAVAQTEEHQELGDDDRRQRALEAARTIRVGRALRYEDRVQRLGQSVTGEAVEKSLDGARWHLSNALRNLRVADTPLPTVEAADLEQRLQSCRRLAELINQHLAGGEVDWDAELRQLGVQGDGAS